MIGQPGCYGIDPTKLCINVRRLGLTGRRAEEILRRDYRIQVELSDPYNVLALVTIGDNKQNVRRLVNAVQQISGRYPVRPVPERELDLPGGIPELALVPKEAFYADKRPHEFKAASGKICGELIMRIRRVFLLSVREKSSLKRSSIILRNSKKPRPGSRA